MKRFLFVNCFIFVTLWVSGCATEFDTSSMERTYDSAIRLMDNELYAQAIPQFQKIIDENPGTRYASYSYLKIADAYLDSEDSSNYEIAEANYRVFLSHNSNSHLVPYVLSRLIELNYKKNTHFLFGESYAYARDPDHFKKILDEFQRFTLLYPESTYIEDARVYYDKSVNALAEHELLIADWYFDHSLYLAAISRYEYILNRFPDFRKQIDVADKLIVAYLRNQQPERAAELQRIVDQEISR